MIRVLVVDDQELLRRGLRMLLESTGKVTVVGEARDGNEALSLIPALEPDVVVTDAVMPGMGGVALIDRCSERHPGLPLVMVTTFDTHDLITSAIEAGAAGILLKDTSPERIVEALTAALSGEMVLDPRVAHVALRGTTTSRRDPLQQLTPAERQVAELIGQGRTNAQIVDELVLAPGTVKNYVSTIMRRLGFTDRTALALFIDRASRDGR